jgi:phosphonatase-like hydrolase
MTTGAALAATLRLAVLDMAGTTIDVADGVPEALRESFAAFGLNLPEDAIVRMRGQSKREAIRTLVRGFSSSGDDDSIDERMYASFRETLRTRYSRSVKAIAGAQETIRWLRAHNIAVVLATGFDRDMAALLIERVGWGNDPVSGIVSSDDVHHGRPEPDMIFRAMELCSIRNPSAVAVVGDTTADLESGKRAGAGAIIGVLSGAHSRGQLESHPHTVILNSIAALPAWLETH